MEQISVKGGTAGQIADPPKLKYCLYARKSTEADERQTLSIDSQIKEMAQIAQKEGLEITDIRKEAHSAKASGQRPVYNKMLEDIRTGQFNAILTWAPDRLSRNAGDLGVLVDLMDQKVLVEIKTYSQKFTNSPNEKFLLMILGSQAKLENDNRGLNVKRGLRTKAQMGLWPGMAPTGYLNEKRTDRKGYVMIDPKRAPVVKQIFKKVATEGWSGRKVYIWLRQIKFTSVNNKPLTLGNVYRLLQNSFYYGMFQYPKNSGNWCTGRHEPIITKEVFDKAQEAILNRSLQTKSESKEFAFTKLITCGVCGSGITAQEKFKRQKNGNIHHYIYYNCSRSRDINCENEYIREEKLIEQLLSVIDKLKLGGKELKDKINREVDRYYEFGGRILGIEHDEEKRRIDRQKYVRYILTKGSVYEKRDLLSCLKNKLLLKGKTIAILTE